MSRDRRDKWTDEHPGEIQYFLNHAHGAFCGWRVSYCLTIDSDLIQMEWFNITTVATRQGFQGRFCPNDLGKVA